MPKARGQKLKLMYLYKFLFEQSDENHPIATAELVSALHACGIPAERKSIYSDLAALEEFGVDIGRSHGSPAGYFINSRAFSVPELQLLANAVASSKFITEKKSQELIRKITSLTNVQTAGRINRQIYILNRRKHVNEQIYYNIDRIHDAVSESREITFRYFDYTLSKEKRYRRGGEPYTATPYALCWDDDNYYMIAYYPRYDAISNFRVDRMDYIALGEYRAPDERRRSFSIAEYTQGLFSMFGGEKLLARLEFSAHLIGAVLDRFGRDVAVERTGEDRFAVCADIVVSPAFWGWLFQFGADARVLGPEPLRAAAAEESRRLYALYHGDGAVPRPGETAADPGQKNYRASAQEGIDKSEGL